MWHEEIQKEPFVFRPCGQYEITLRQLIEFTHGSTEILKIEVVCDCYAPENMPKGARTIPDVLSNDVFGKMTNYMGDKDNDEVRRLLKYYGDCPCWNLVARISLTCRNSAVPVLIAHVHFRDIRASFIQERKDIQKANRERRRAHRSDLLEGAGT